MCSRSDHGVLGVALAALVVTGCDGAHHDDVALGQASAVDLSVGPVPGPHADGGATANPFGANPVALLQGRRYFNQYNCSGCHGDHGGGGMGPSLRDTEWIYGGNDAQIFDSIAEGRAHGMPAWGVKLPDEIVWKLVTYVRSMRQPDEPDPPDQSVPEPPRIP